MKKIGIIGTRRRSKLEDFVKVKKMFINLYEEGDWIVSGGGTKGGNYFALKLHKELFIPYLEFPANWEKYGKNAGFVRNTSIAEYSDILIACVAEDRKGGTEDTIKKFLKLNNKKYLFLV
jgi:hypothetical protein